MTNELEKKFFDTFGIEISRCTKDGNCYFQECSKCDWYIHTYPQITDRILLELICKLSGVCCPYFASKRSISEIKETVLKLCIAYKDLLKQQVRTLFKGQ